MSEGFKTFRVWDELKHLDPNKVTKQSLASYHVETNTYTLPVINQEYIVDVNARKVLSSRKQTREKTAWELQMLIPIYLVNAKRMQIKGTWISPHELDGGHLFFTAPAHNLYFNDLLKKYNASSEFLKAGLALNGKKRSIINVAFEICVLPRIPLLFIYRSGGNEFTNHIQVLFDASAKLQLPTDSLWLTIEYSKRCLLELN